MHVAYSVHGEPSTFEVDDHNTLRDLRVALEGHLRVEHPDAAANPRFAILTNDAILDSLANDGEAINLSELLQDSPAA